MSHSNRETIVHTLQAKWITTTSSEFSKNESLNYVSPEHAVGRERGRATSRPPLTPQPGEGSDTFERWDISHCTQGGITWCKVAPAKFLKTRCPQQQLWVQSRGDRSLSLFPWAEPRCAPRPPSRGAARLARGLPGSPASPWATPARPHLLAVRGRTLLPQAAPVEQVSRLQVQGAGPRQERPGRATVGAHGSGQQRGLRALRPQAEEEAVPQTQPRGRRAGHAAACPARRGLGLRSGPGRPAAAAAAREGRAGAAAPAAAAAAETGLPTEEAFPGRQ